MAPLKSVDTGINTTVTTRATVAAGMPASNDAADYGTANNTAARPDTADPPDRIHQSAERT